MTDSTRLVKFTASPEGLITIDPTGLVTPLADGTVTVKATADDGATAASTLVVSGTGREQPVSFVGQVVPIFTKLGATAAGATAKLPAKTAFGCRCSDLKLPKITNVWSPSLAVAAFHWRRPTEASY